MTTPRDDMDTLLDEGIEAATQFLEESREFCPFAIVLAADGEVRYVQCEPEDEFTQSEGLIAITENTLRALAESAEIRASAVVSDVYIHGKDEDEADTDAIRVSLEHVAGGPVTCYLPYTIEGDEVVPGELVAEEGDAVVFEPVAPRDEDEGAGPGFDVASN